MSAQQKQLQAVTREEFETFTKKYLGNDVSTRNTTHMSRFSEILSSVFLSVSVLGLGCPAVAGGLHARGPRHRSAERQLQLSVDHQSTEQR